MRPPPDAPNQNAGRRRANDLDTGFVADSRRRLGGHGRARRFLVSDHGAAVAAEGIWRGLVSALQRHSVQNALGEMSPEDREVLTLAYLQGYTNSEIAARLRVSASTVRRRLSVALARLEKDARRSGAWISSIATAVLLKIVEPSTRLGRMAGGIRHPDWSTGLAAAVTIGVMGAVGVGVFVADQHSTGVNRAGAPATAHIAGLPFVTTGAAQAPEEGLPADPAKIGEAGVPPAVTRDKSSGVTVASAHNAADSKEGCGGNPTNAPPAVPVGSRASHPSGAPVTHPSAGGCDKD